MVLTDTPHRVVTNLQFIKNTVFVKYTKAKCKKQDRSVISNIMIKITRKYRAFFFFYYIILRNPDCRGLSG